MDERRVLTPVRALGTLRSMTRGDHVLLGPRGLLPALVLLLVLGHVCELPAYADLFSHHTAEAHHADHHAGHSQISCDAIDAVSNTGSLNVAHVVDLAYTVSIAVVAPLRSVNSAIEPSTTARGRPPLFVLYASLLI
jgi:hypothetical protein